MGKWSNLTNIFSNGFKPPTCSVQEMLCLGFLGCLFCRLARLCDIFCGTKILRFYFGIQNPWRFAHASLSTRPTLRWGNLANAMWQLAWNKRNIVIIDVSTSRKCHNCLNVVKLFVFFWCVFSILWTQFWWVSLSRPILMLGCNYFCSTREIRTGPKWIFLALGLPGT